VHGDDVVRQHDHGERRLDGAEQHGAPCTIRGLQYFRKLRKRELHVRGTLLRLYLSSISHGSP
jgi:hypothetical protein